MSLFKRANKEEAEANIPSLPQGLNAASERAFSVRIQESADSGLLGGSMSMHADHPSFLRPQDAAIENAPYPPYDVSNPPETAQINIDPVVVVRQFLMHYKSIVESRKQQEQKVINDNTRHVAELNLRSIEIEVQLSILNRQKEEITHSLARANGHIARAQASLGAHALVIHDIENELRVMSGH